MSKEEYRIEGIAVTWYHFVVVIFPLILSLGTFSYVMIERSEKRITNEVHLQTLTINTIIERLNAMDKANLALQYEIRLVKTQHGNIVSQLKRLTKYPDTMGLDPDQMNPAYPN